ncbi:MAG: hypothetical protein ACQESY_07395, partial [Pseudomonadota bacterium]
MRILIVVLLTAAMSGCALPSSTSGDVQIEPTAPPPEHVSMVVGDAPFPLLMRDETVYSLLSDEPAPAPDIWQRIRDGFELTDVDHSRVEQQLSWYAR